MCPILRSIPLPLTSHPPHLGSWATLLADNFVLIVFTQSQYIQKTKNTATMLVHKQKVIKKLHCQLNVHRHGVNDVRWKSSIGDCIKVLFFSERMHHDISFFVQIHDCLTAKHVHVQYGLHVLNRLLHNIISTFCFIEKIFWNWRSIRKHCQGARRTWWA